MRKLLIHATIASVVLILILGVFQLASGSIPMVGDPGAQPNVGWNGRLTGYLLDGQVQPNVGWNGKAAADIAAPDEVVCYDGFLIRPMVGWNG